MLKKIHFLKKVFKDLELLNTEPRSFAEEVLSCSEEYYNFTAEIMKNHLSLIYNSSNPFRTKEEYYYSIRGSLIKYFANKNNKIANKMLLDIKDGSLENQLKRIATEFCDINSYYNVIKGLFAYYSKAVETEKKYQELDFRNYFMTSKPITKSMEFYTL